MPEPSRLVLLEQLHTIQAGTKIRFLACVHTYNIQQAHLTLTNNYPATDSLIPTAVVSVENVLENLNHELLEVGTWLNIIGYVRLPPDAKEAESVPSKEHFQPERKAKSTFIEATMIWSAGAIKLDRYISAAREYQKSVMSV